MDLTESIAPKSDQLNADDLIGGPVTVTIREVTAGNPEQPVNVALVEFPNRAYRPSKSMRRVMVLAWGAEAAAYVGRKLTLYRNPEITFGKDKVGGIEISHLTHLEKPLTVALTATRGKRKSFTVKPLVEVVRRDFLAESEAIGPDEQRLRALWLEAKNVGEPAHVLDAIREAATLTPAPDAAPAA